jgi:hypothetical protein
MVFFDNSASAPLLIAFKEEGRITVVRPEIFPPIFKEGRNEKA